MGKKSGDITRICFNREASGHSLGCLCYHDDSMLHYLPISCDYRFSTHLLPLTPICQFLTICILNRHENIPKKWVLDAIAVHDKNSCRLAVDMPFVICRSTTFDLVNRSKQKEKGSG